jgi:hypothetical protein
MPRRRRSSGDSGSGFWPMTELSGPEKALGEIARALFSRRRRFALVGGLAVSARAEPRFTRDVDIAVAVRDDSDAERLVHELAAERYTPVATVEHEVRNRLSTVRLVGHSGVKTDLLFASSGIEPEVCERATELTLPGVGTIPVARGEELVAMKVLSMTAQRLQDRLDAQRLLQMGTQPRLDEVRADLDLIAARGYHREQDLHAKLAEVLVEIGLEPG